MGRYVRPSHAHQPVMIWAQSLTHQHHWGNMSRRSGWSMWRTIRRSSGWHSSSLSRWPRAALIGRLSLVLQIDDGGIPHGEPLLVRRGSGGPDQMSSSGPASASRACLCTAAYSCLHALIIPAFTADDHERSTEMVADYKYKSSWDCARRIIAERGPRGIFQGLSATLCR